MKQIPILIIAIICGVAAMFLTQLYLRKKVDNIKAQYGMVKVLAAKKDIPVGTTITENTAGEYLKVSETLKRQVNVGNVTPEQADLLLNRAFQSTVLANTPVLWSHIKGEEHRGGGLASMVGENERALSIPVDITSSVTGLVEPNDHVDILGTFTFPSAKGDIQLDTVTLTILQNVTVLATGKDTAQTLMDAGLRGTVRRGTSYSTVTLLVTPKEAEMLVFAMQKGRLTLTLRNPADVSSARDLTNINFNYLEKKVGEFNDARQARLKGGTTPTTP